MSLAPQEIDKSAIQYASDAIKYDSQGARGMAIAHYQKAVESLFKLLRLYPDSKLNKIYTDRLKSYQNRIKSLQAAHGVDLEPAVDPKATPAVKKVQAATTKVFIYLYQGISEFFPRCIVAMLKEKAAEKPTYPK